MYGGASAGTPPSAVYHLKFQARCITPQTAESERSRFLVGTINLREENEVHVIQFNDDANEVRCDRVYSHLFEVWSLSACPSDSSLFFSCYNTGTQFRASLWRMPGLDARGKDAGVNIALEEKTSIEPKGPHIRCVLWNPAGASDTVLSLDEASLRLWNLGAGSSQCSEEISIDAGNSGSFWTAAWDPHFADQCVTANNSSIRAWDLRSRKQTHCVENAHSVCVRDVDYNPNKPYVLVSGGDDNLIKFWDLRRPSASLATLAGHHHWVWNVKYNPFHDQLVASSSTDCMVNLWKAAAVSSTPDDVRERTMTEDSTAPSPSSADSDSAEGKGGAAAPADGLVSTYEMHEESVYSLCWSACDSWVFASVSYDGRVAVNHVPQSEKYRIIL